MKTSIIRLSIIFILAAGKFLNAMEQESESELECAIQYLTDSTESSSNNETSWAISNDIVLPDILTWVIGEMCENGDTNFNELEELLESGRYDICQAFNVALNYKNREIALFLAERGVIDTLKSKGTPESTIKRIMKFLYPEKSRTGDQEKNHAITAGKQSNDDPLTLAVCRKDSKEVKRLLEKKHSPNIIFNNQGVTLLHIAACKGDKRTVKLLMRYGAEIDRENKSGATPLIFAAQMGHTAVGQLLLKHGANVNKKDNRCFTALWWARQKKQAEFEQLLINWGGEEYAIVTILPYEFKSISNANEETLPSLQD